MKIETRQKIEREIVTRVVNDALAEGFAIQIDNGGDDCEFEHPSHNQQEILSHLFATDDEKLFLYRGYAYRGFIQFIYGNDGTDVIADHTASVELEQMLAGAYKLAGELEEKYS